MLPINVNLVQLNARHVFLLAIALNAKMLTSTTILNVIHNVHLALTKIVRLKHAFRVGPIALLAIALSV